MKKTKFKLEINCNGVFNDQFVSIITNHNEGRTHVSLDIFLMCVKTKYNTYPSITPETTIKQDVGNHTIEVWEKDKHTMTIQECVYDELGEIGKPAEDDLQQLESVENISQLPGNQC